MRRVQSLLNIALALTGNFIPCIQAKKSFRTLTLSKISIRQTEPDSPTAAELKCESQCQVLNTDCADRPECFCTVESLNQVATCTECVYNAATGEEKEALTSPANAQQWIEDSAAECRELGFNIEAPTLDLEGSSGESDDAGFTAGSIGPGSETGGTGPSPTGTVSDGPTNEETPNENGGPGGAGSSDSSEDSAGGDNDAAGGAAALLAQLDLVVVALGISGAFMVVAV